MARNGLSAVQTNEPNELYDSLSQDGQDQWDAIGLLGYKPEKGAAGLWFARKPGQKANDAIGPGDSINALHSQVKAAVPAEDSEDANDSATDAASVPSTRLPGMEEPDIEELNAQADKVRDAKMALDKAKAKHADEADFMKELLKTHSRKRCRHGGWNHTVEESEKLVSKPETKEQKAKNEPELKAAA